MAAAIIRSLGKMSVLSLCYSKPLVFVLGATGCGKSKLGIEIAQKFNGEIISADSMQVYEGLDITTNKVTQEEMQGVPHHLLDFVDPLATYTVVDFRNHVLPIINEIHENLKLPIIVGGTNYYVESLLWDFLISPFENNDLSQKILDSEREKIQSKIGNLDDIISHTIIPSDLDGFTNFDLHNLLSRVDPERGNNLHPNDRRKVIRSLQVYQQTGKLHSQLLNDQRSQNGGCSVSGPLRFSKSIIFWVQCKTEVLDKRIDDRVDNMIARGLVEEMSSFHMEYNKCRLLNGGEADYTRGIFQSIGFKEFHEYLILDDLEKLTEHGKKLFETGTESMKRVTRNYAKKQNRWIENRILKKTSRESPPVYALDSSDVQKWNQEVRDISYEILASFLSDLKSNRQPLPIEDYFVENKLETFFCEICDQIIVGTLVWETHLNSRRHGKRKSKKLKSSLAEILKNE